MGSPYSRRARRRRRGEHRAKFTGSFSAAAVRNRHELPHLLSVDVALVPADAVKDERMEPQPVIRELLFARQTRAAMSGGYELFRESHPNA